MRFPAKVDWSIWLSLLFPLIVAAIRTLWMIPVAVAVLAVLAIGWVLPQYYELRGDGLFIRAGLRKRLIAYADVAALRSTPTVRWALVSSKSAQQLEYGAGEIILIAPADMASFEEELLKRAPHLSRQGFDLVQRLA